MRSGEPLDCPFCGSIGADGNKTKVGTFTRSGWWVVECENPDCPVKPSTPGHEKRKHAIDAWNDRRVSGSTSDGFHTFDELYHQRAVLFSVIASRFPDRAWKSKKHATGDMYEGMFIAGIDTPGGPATYHFDIDPYWDMLECRELESAPKWDGHSPAQAIERMATLAEVPRG